MDDRIKAKLQKLLALAANNPSPEEAAAAFARAQEMATRHRIELASIEIGEDPADPADAEMVDECISVVKGSKVMGWKKRLAWGMDSLGVFPLVQGGHGTVSFAGKRADVQTAIYMYRAISAEIERLAREQCAGKGRRYANAFKLGASNIVVQRLHAAHKSTIQDARASGVSESALVLVTNAEDRAESWYRARPDVSIRKSPAIRHSSAEGRRAGHAAGQNINIGNNTAINRGARAAIS